jgi:hypothetical protein
MKVFNTLECLPAGSGKGVDLCNTIMFEKSPWPIRPPALPNKWWSSLKEKSKIKEIIA